MGWDIPANSLKPRVPKAVALAELGTVGYWRKRIVEQAPGAGRGNWKLLSRALIRARACVGSCADRSIGSMIVANERNSSNEQRCLRAATVAWHADGP
jgi:hypothetical protein